MMKKPKSRTAEVMAGKSKKHKTAHRIHIRKAANGGFIAENHYKPDEGEMPPEPEEHALPDMAALHDHLDSHMSEEPEPEQGGGGQPMPAPQMGAM